MVESQFSEVLLDAARSNLYRINAFRIAEMPIDASARELSKRQRIVEMANNTGLQIPSGSGRAIPLDGSTNPNRADKSS